MNIKLYNAVIAQLRANAIRELAEIESLLNSSVTDDTVQVAVAKVESLVQSEGALHTMQQYFQPRPAQPVATPPPAPSAPVAPPKKITEEMSATYKKSIAAEKKRKKAEEDRIKRESAAKSKATKAKKESKDE
jgi:hypothetical protein